MHVFNSAPVMQLVELIPSLISSAETLDRMRSWVTETLGKKPIDAIKERLYSPPPLFDRMVDAGLLGKKTQQGFDGYEP